jgi:putative thioredoxin
MPERRSDCKYLFAIAARQANPNILRSLGSYCFHVSGSARQLKQFRKTGRRSTMNDIIGQTPAQGAADVVKDTTTATFRQDVLAESTRQPVLVDFWAPWCGPCKQLDPILKKVVTAAGGKVKLVKMNIDEHPQIAGQLGIKSIPAVVAFQKGQPVDGFAGALPESQVKGFIERLVGPLGGEVDDLLAAGDEALAARQIDAALEAYHSAFELEPANPKAAAGLARTLVEAGDLEAAKALLADLPVSPQEGPELAAARAAVALAAQAAEIGAFGPLEEKVKANPLDHQARFDLAVAYNAAGQREAAADALLEIIRRDRTWNDDGARKQLLQFFEAWGPVEPDTVAARRKLSGLLFS